MRLFFLSILLAVLMTVPAVVFAQGTAQYIPIVGVPGVDPNNTTTEGYINAFFTLAIGVAAALAVLKIIAAGVQYMFSEVVTSKEQAKKDIWGALLGLLIILGGVTILETINTDLTKFDALSNAPKFSETYANSSVGSNVGDTLGLEGTSEEQRSIFAANCDSINGIIATNETEMTCQEEGWTDTTGRYLCYVSPACWLLSD